MMRMRLALLYGFVLGGAVTISLVILIVSEKTTPIRIHHLGEVF